MIDHPPQLLIVRAQQPRRSRHTHLLRQQQDQPFHHQRKPAAGPRPRQLYLQHPVLGTTHPRRPRPQIGAMLSGVRVPPLLLRGVVHRAELPATRTGKLGPRREIQRQTQLPLRQVQLAFDQLPLSAKSWGLTEESIGIHPGHPERPDHRLQVAGQPTIQPCTP